MKVYLFGVFLVLILVSSFVCGDVENEEDKELQPRFFFRESCRKHEDCPEHKYCSRSQWCIKLPKCYWYYGCPKGTTCKSYIYAIFYHTRRCVRSGTLCSSHADCNQSTECCRSNRYFKYCAKRPQEGERCCPRYDCYKCAEGLVCHRRQHHWYGTCRPAPTTVPPATVEPTSEGSGDFGLDY